LSSYSYYDDGRVKDSTDPEGAVTPLGHVRSLTYPTTFDNITGNNITTSFTEKDGGQWSYTYDITTGRLKEKIAPDDGVTSQLLRTTSYTYYADGRKKSATIPGTEGIRYTTFYTYDTNGNLASETSPANLAAYTPAIDPEDIADPSVLASNNPPIKTAFLYTYDLTNTNTTLKNRIKSISDVRSAVTLITTYGYSTNVYGNLSSTTIKEGYLPAGVTNPDSLTVVATTVTQQNPDGRITKNTDANNKDTTYSYYPDTYSPSYMAKQLQSITYPDNTVVSYTGYDTNGNNTEMKVRDTDGTVRKTIVMAYDVRNRLITSTTQVSGQTDIVTSYGYDNNDNQNYVKDAEQHETRLEYNYNRQVTKITDADTEETKFIYGGTGCSSCGGGVDKLTEVYDAKFAKKTPLEDQPHTAYQYDQLGRLQYETDPLGNKLHYTYHENGQLKQKYDATALPEKLLITYSYHPHGMLAKKHYSDGTPDTTYGYDDNDRLQTAANGNISYTYAYYDSGAYTGRLKSITDNTNNRTSTYDQYDGLGQKKQVTVKNGTEQRTFAYDYDSANRPWTITSDAGAFTYLYDKLGRRQTITGSNPGSGIVSTYGHDTLDRLTGLTHTAGAATIAYVNYTDFDKVGNRKDRITPSSTTTYRYDPLYRLEYAYTPGSTTYYQDQFGQVTQVVIPTIREDYLYDEAGNRTIGPGAKDTAYLPNDANQMQHGRMFSYTYDNAGNQKTRSLSAMPIGMNKSWEQNWDLDNRLVKVEITANTLKRRLSPPNYINTATVTDNRTVTFKYDPFDRRIEKTVTITSDGTVTNGGGTWSYLYEGDNIAVEYYTPTGGTVEKTWYTHGAGTDEHLAMERGGQYYYFLQDGLGSITTITDAGKNVVQSYEYDSFGMAKPSTGFRNVYQFAGREYDRETGLYFNRARYYDPMEGRFIQKDPIGFAGGDVNLYNYVGANPVNRRDPKGLCVEDACIVEGAIAAAAACARNPACTSAVAATTAAIGAAISNAFSDWRKIPDVSNWPGIGDLFFPPEPPNADRCKQVEEECYAECSASEVGCKGSKYDQGTGFRKCVRECKAKHGC
ncbi:MAG TPA: hypothetical protein DER40_07235, partial [Geobacter sp.]|nr:hypothetical protein [Geobacter sp.]